ncbi:MAG: hypothetical protein SGCHY_005001 [Lobulomycetales sp.]
MSGNKEISPEPLTTDTKAADGGKGSPSGQSPKSPAAAVNTTPYLTVLLRYATGWEIILMVIGSFFAMCNGAALPAMTFIFGDTIDALIVYPFAVLDDRDQAIRDLDSAVTETSIYFVIIGAAAWIASYFQMYCWSASAEIIAKRIRTKYLESILYQEVAWFDTKDTGDLTTRLIADIAVVQEGTGDKVGLLFQFGTTFFGGFILAFVRGWKLALVLVAPFPLLGATSYFMSKILASGTNANSTFYAEAGSIAQQVISNIRTVTAFNGQKRAIEKYNTKILDAEKSGIKNQLATAGTMSSVWCLIFLCYALAFWYGSTLAIAGEMTGGEVLNVFFAIIIGAFTLGNAGPSFSAIAAASGVATNVFETIERKSKIDASSNEGEKIEEITGQLSFRGLNFAYPTRPDVPILEDFSLEVDEHSVVALVGSSGRYWLFY